MSEDDLKARVAALEAALYGMHPDSPGIALRMDRIERSLGQAIALVKWFAGGGVLSLAATAYLFYRIMQVMPAQ